MKKNAENCLTLLKKAPGKKSHSKIIRLQKKKNNTLNINNIITISNITTKKNKRKNSTK